MQYKPNQTNAIPFNIIQYNKIPIPVQYNSMKYNTIQQNNTKNTLQYNTIQAGYIS